MKILQTHPSSLSIRFIFSSIDAGSTWKHGGNWPGNKKNEFVLDFLAVLAGKAEDFHMPLNEVGCFHWPPLGRLLPGGRRKIK